MTTTDISSNATDSPKYIDEIFTLIQVRVEKNSAGVDYIRLRVVSKLGSFFQDVPMNKRGLKKANGIAKALGLEIYFEPAALDLMNAHE